MKKSCLFIFLFLVHGFLWAENDNFLPGYVITQSGDSIVGTILYKGNKTPNKTCVLRPEDGGEEIVYTPGDLFMYRFFGDKCYVPVSILLEGTEQKVFLEYLLNGIVNIYYYGFLDKYYIKDESGRLIELTDDVTDTYINGAHYVGKSKKYVGILKHVFRKDLKTVKKLDAGQVKLKQKDLISIARDYHNAVCTDWSCVVYDKNYGAVKKKEQVFKLQRLHFGISTGFDYNLIPFSESFIAENEHYLIEATDVSAMHAFFPSIGVFVNYNLFFISPKLDLKYDLCYNPYRSTNHYKYITGRVNYADRNYDYEFSLKRQYINNSLYLKYNFVHAPDHDVFVQAGYSLAYAPYQIYNRIGEYTYRHSTTTSVYHVSLDTPDIKQHIDVFEQGVGIGCGYLKRLGVLSISGDIRYQAVFGKMLVNKAYMSEINYDMAGYAGHNISVNIGVGFNLKKK